MGHHQPTRYCFLYNTHIHSETLQSLFLPVLPPLLHSYPTGQAGRKETSFSSEWKEIEAELSERRSDGGVERRLSEGSTRGWKANMIKQALLYGSQNRLFLEPLGNYCLQRLLMLYYKGSRLNGLWSPFGFETQKKPEDQSYPALAKWPVEPVRV